MTAAAPGVAGCSAGSSTDGDAGTSSPRATRAGGGGTPTTPAETPTTANSRGHLEAMSAYLAANAEDVEVRELRVDEANATVRLRYVTTRTGSNELAAEIGTIAGGFLRELSAGWEMDRMEATMVDESGSPRATWHVEAAWYEQYESGEITGDELSLKILDTLERAG